MQVPIELTSDYDAAQLRAAARRSQDTDQWRRLLALAAIYEGATRSEAAAIGGMTTSSLRHWVLKLNECGPEGLVRGKSTGRQPVLNGQHRAALAKAVEEGPIPAVHGVARWRIIDLCQWFHNEFEVTVSSQTLSSELRALGYRKLSTPPHHHAQTADDMDPCKQISPRAWMRSDTRVIPMRTRDPAAALTNPLTEVLASLPAGIDLDGIALKTKAIQFKREVTSGAALLQIALARGPGGMSLRQTANWASLHGIAELTDPAVKYRLDRATNFLVMVSEQIMAAKAPGAGLRWPGRTLRLIDRSSLDKSSVTGADWRIHGVFDFGRGGFSHLELTDAKALDRGTPHAGEIYIGNLNYAHASILQRFHAKCGGTADFIVRVDGDALQLTGPAGGAFDLSDYLQRLPPGAGLHEVNMQASVSRDEPALAVQLITQRKTPKQAEATRAALHSNAARRGETPDARSLIAAEFLILATSLPESRYTGPAIFAAYRLRWQIELAFKRLRSSLHIDNPRTGGESGSRGWLYAHLILALLRDTLSPDFLEY